MKQTFYERIGEAVCRETLPNGLRINIVPKRDYAKSYAFFALTRTVLCPWILTGQERLS